MLHTDTLPIIKQLLALDYKEPSPFYSNFNIHSISKDIADLLLGSKLQPNINTELKVQEYLNSIQKKSTKEDSVDIKELEECLLIEIINGNVRLLPRDIDKVGETPLEKRLFPIAQKLKSRLNAKENIAKYTLLESNFDQKVASNYLLKKLFQENNEKLIEHTSYGVQFNAFSNNDLMNDYEGLVVGYLWKALVAEKNGFSQLVDYITNLQIDIWKIEFVDMESKEEFNKSVLSYFTTTYCLPKLDWDRESIKQHLKSRGICHSTISLDNLIETKKVNINSLVDAYIWLENQRIHPDYFDLNIQLMSFLLREANNNSDLKYLFNSAKSNSYLTVTIFIASHFYKDKLLEFLLSDSDYIDLAFHIIALYQFTQIPWRYKQEISAMESVLWNLSITHLKESTTYLPKEQKKNVLYNSLLAVSLAAISFSGVENTSANNKLKNMINSLDNITIPLIQSQAINLKLDVNRNSFHAHLNLLFLLLKRDKSEELKKFIASIYIERIEAQISELSNKTSNTIRSENSLSFCPLELFEKYPWDILDCSIVALTDKNILGKIKASYSSIPRDKRHTLDNIVRGHVLILLIASKNNHQKEEVFDELFEFVREFAFDGENFGIFNYITDGHSYGDDSKVSLNSKFSAVLDNIDDSTFKELIKLLKRKKVTTFQLLNYANTISKEHRAIEIIKILNARSPEEINDATMTDELKKSVNLAHYIGLYNIRDMLKADGKSNSHKSFSNDWNSIEYQYNLIDILNEDIEKEEKFKKINSLEKELQDVVSSPFNKNNLNYISYIRAQIFLESEAQKSCHILHELCKSDKQELYTTALFCARIMAFEQKHVGAKSIEQSIAEWSHLSGQPLTNCDDYSESEIAILLQAYSLSDNASAFNKLWASLTPRLLFSFNISEIYIKECVRSDQMSVANEYFDKLANYHNLSEVDSEGIKTRVAKLKQYISSPSPAIIKSELIHIGSTEDVIAGLAIKWREIQSLNHEELARVISPVTVKENHLFELIHETNLVIFQDLISQRIYFREKKRPKNTNTPEYYGLVDEDHISAMYLKTIKNKYSMFGWHVSDQNKVGISSEGKGLGEADGRLTSRTGESIAFFEALILDSLDQKELNKHLNKVSGYDTAASPLVIFAVYYSGKSFEGFKAKYHKHINYYSTQNYKKPASHNINILEENDRLYCFTEKRERGGKEVEFTHYVMNLLH